MYSLLIMKAGTRQGKSKMEKDSEQSLMSISKLRKSRMSQNSAHLIGYRERPQDRLLSGPAQIEGRSKRGLQGQNGIRSLLLYGGFFRQRRVGRREKRRGRGHKIGMACLIP